MFLNYFSHISAAGPQTSWFPLGVPPGFWSEQLPKDARKCRRWAHRPAIDASPSFFGSVPLQLSSTVLVQIRSVELKSRIKSILIRTLDFCVCLWGRGHDGIPNDVQTQRSISSFRKQHLIFQNPLLDNHLEETPELSQPPSAVSSSDVAIPAAACRWRFRNYAVFPLQEPRLTPKPQSAGLFLKTVSPVLHSSNISTSSAMIETF